MMKLYYARGTVAVAVAIALEEASLPYETVKIDFAKATQLEPEYVALNPKARVPLLVATDGTLLTETGALLDFIAAIAPKAKLMPGDPLLAAHIRAVMYYLASTMHVAHAHLVRGTRWADQQSSFDDMAAKVPETMTQCATYVENNCLRGDFAAGNHFTIADPYLYMICSWLAGDGVETANFPKITAFLARMETRDSVKAVRTKELL